MSGALFWEALQGFNSATKELFMIRTQPGQKKQKKKKVHGRYLHAN